MVQNPWIARGEHFQMPHTTEMLFIHAAARNILACINEAPCPQPDDRTSSLCVSFNRRLEKPSQKILDASGAQRLESGNFILGDAVNEGLCAWAVLVPLEFQRDFAFVAFRVRGIIHIALDPSLFIEKSYLYILNRPADAHGMSTYLPGLTNGALSHAALLFALAASLEARNQYERLLVYPIAEGSALDAGNGNSTVPEFERFLLSKEIFSEPVD